MAQQMAQRRLPAVERAEGARPLRDAARLPTCEQGRAAAAGRATADRAVPRRVLDRARRIRAVSGELRVSLQPLDLRARGLAGRLRGRLPNRGRCGHAASPAGAATSDVRLLRPRALRRAPGGNDRLVSVRPRLGGSVTTSTGSTTRAGGPGVSAPST